MKTAAEWMTHMGFKVEQETPEFIVASYSTRSGWALLGLIAVRNTRGGTHMAVNHLRWVLGKDHCEYKKVSRLFRGLLEGATHG